MAKVIWSDLEEDIQFYQTEKNAARTNNTAIDLKTHSRAVRERENEEKIKFDWIVKVESFH